MKQMNLRPLTADAASKLDVLRHDRDALRVDSAQSHVLKKPDEVRLGRLLQHEYGSRLEARCVRLFLRDVAHKSLKGELAEQQLLRALKLANVAQGDRARPVAALDRGLSTGLGRPPRGSPRQTSRRLADCRPPCRILRPRHCCGRHGQWQEQMGAAVEAHDEESKQRGAVGRAVREGGSVGASQLRVGAAGAGRDSDQGWRGNRARGKGG